MSEDTYDETDARRLIETVFGTGDKFAEYTERADKAATAFIDAAEAYARSELVASAMTLENYVNDAESRAQGCFDLCTAGAAKVAALFADLKPCEHEECDGVRLDMEGAPDEITRTAIQIVNTAADREPVMLGVILSTLHDLAGPSGLQVLASALIDMYPQVCDMVRDDI